MGTPMLTPETRIVRSAAALATAVNGDVVILNIDRNEYVHIDTIGSEIWSRIEQPVSITDIARALADEYDAPGDVICKDVTEFAERMISLGLLRQG